MNFKYFNSKINAMNIVILFWILFVTSIIGYFMTNKNIMSKKKVNQRIINKKNITQDF